VNVAVGATIAKIASKVLQILLGDKKGRKFLGYVVGIAIFIVLLPVLAVYGLFGWMATDGADSIFNYEMIYEQMPEEQRVLFEQYEPVLSQIEIVFDENGLQKSDASKAKTIFISCLTGKEVEENFYQRYADCFLNVEDGADVLSNISSAFGVEFSESERQQFDNLYGG
jgi:hypothetical protein